MMKISGILVLSVILAAGAIRAEAPFRVGEKMRYEIRALGMAAASQELEIEYMTNINGRRAYKIHSEIRTLPAVNPIYYYKDTSDSYLDAETFNCLKVWSMQKERNWDCNTLLTNSVSQNRIYYWSYKPYKDKHKFKKLVYSKPVIDLIGMAYLARTVELTKGNYYTFNIIDYDKIRPITAKVVGKETIRVKALEPHKVETWKLEQVGEDDVAIWITADERRIPVKIQSMEIELAGMKLGHIYSVLEEYKSR